MHRAAATADNNERSSGLFEKRPAERRLLALVSGAGCRRATLYKNGEDNRPLIRRFVAKQIIDDPVDKLYLDRIDHDTSENCMNNLRWANDSHNHTNKTKQLNTS